MKLCECGCGQETPIHVGKTCRRAFLVRGMPRRFVDGHQVIYRSNQEKERRRQMNDLMEIIRPKRHQNYPNPKCLYCGNMRSFWSGSLCSFCWHAQAALKRTGITVPKLVNANFDFDRKTFARLCRLMLKKRALDELVTHLATSLAVRKFRNQQKQKMPCPIETGAEIETDGYVNPIAITTRTPLDDMLEKEEINGQRDSVLRARTRHSKRNRAEDVMVDKFYQQNEAPFKPIATPGYFKKYKDDSRNTVGAFNVEDAK